MEQSPRLLGFNITKIQAEKNTDFKGKLEIQSNVNIINIEKHKIEIAKQDSLKVDFSLDIDYKELGKISIHGTLFLTADNKLMKETLNNWKNKKHSELQLKIINIILQRASIKALQIEEELGLPPPIQLPRAQMQKSSE